MLVCGAEKLPPALIEEFHAKFGITPLEGYGCTELSPVVSVNVPDVSVNTLTQIGTKVGTVGQPLPGIAVRIVDADQPESMTPLPIGKEGQVLVTGPNVMRGYLGRDDLNCKKLLSEWYVTGDIARVDDDGFITLTGRLEQFAKIGGEMVPLEHLDETLHKILGSADRMLAVSAVPDPKRGERIVVLYLPTLSMTIAELLKNLSEAGIPNLWIPDERDCFEVAEFPTLGSGKLNLRKVKEMAIDLVNRKKSP